MARHSDLLSSRNHEANFHQTTDPALVSDNRVTAGKTWLDQGVDGTLTKPVLKVRNEANSAWIPIPAIFANKQGTFDATTLADGVQIASPKIAVGQSTIPGPSSPQVITISGASHIYSVAMNVIGGFTSVFLTTPQSFPITGNTFNITSTDGSSREVLLTVIYD